MHSIDNIKRDTGFDNISEIQSTLLAEYLRSFLDKSGKMSSSSFPTYLGKIEASLLAG